MRCEFEVEVSDDSFGFWHAAWGDPQVHTFGCSGTATTEFLIFDEMQAAVVEGRPVIAPEDRPWTLVRLCDEHARLLRKEVATDPFGMSVTRERVLA